MFAALLLVTLGACGEAVPTGTGLNVLLISIDTLRADHLGCYGYSLPTSPHLDAFAAEGVRFARAISQSPWTTPSHMTRFTALHPSSHQLNQTYQNFLRTARVLPEAMVTLAEVLREHGYRTLALTGGGTVAGRLGFDQGFEEYLEGSYTLDDRVWNPLQIWLTSDHGEEFADHDPEKLYDAHGHSQYEELVHVPLLVRFPRYPAAGRVVNAPVGLIDVAPTILDLLGVEIPRAMQGESLAELWTTDRPVRSAVAGEATIGQQVEHTSLRTSRYSYLASYRTGADGGRTGIPGPFVRAELFDLREDPRERRDLLARRPRLAERMRRALEEHSGALEPGAPPEAEPIDEELDAAQRALGYLQ